jgi:succinate dehydrogenase / fumarate reductase cytochrome b subunit
MKFAFFPGCDVPRRGTPELYMATVNLCQRLGIELVELQFATCTGSGILQAKDLRMADTLNAGTLAMAELENLPLMTICSTCQGILSQTNQRLKENPEYLASINEVLQQGGLEYKGTTEVKHLLWILVEDFGLERLKGMVVRPLKGLKVAPFYGCYILRPSTTLGYPEHPERANALESVIATLGAEAVEYRGKNLCCGYPLVGVNDQNSWAMVANHTMEAKELGAEAMVTPCPLCHMNLDGVQPQVAAERQVRIGLPVLHLPQLVGLAVGLELHELGFDRHSVSLKPVLTRLGLDS